MNKLTYVALVAAISIPSLVLSAREKKKNDEPFYRRYLVPGSPLDDKIREQERRVEADPKSADLRNDFGNLLAARRFPSEAQEQYRMAMKLNRHHYLAPYNLGLLYETQGEPGKAIGAYKTSVERNRGFPPSRFRLGRLYEKRGWDAQAIEQYARAISIDPTMRDPRRNPLVVDTRLMARVSLVNYPTDFASASMGAEAGYVEPRLARRAPIDRALSSEDVVEGPGPETAPPPTPASPIPVAAPARVAPTPARVITLPPSAIMPAHGAQVAPTPLVVHPAPTPRG